MTLWADKAPFNCFINYEETRIPSILTITSKNTKAWQNNMDTHFSRIPCPTPWLVNSVGFTGENILRIMYAWINKVDEENSKEAGSRKKCKVRKKSGIRRREDVIVIWQRRWCRLQWAWQNVFFAIYGPWFSSQIVSLVCAQRKDVHFMTFLPSTAPVIF